jgi:metaxin
VDPSNSDQIQQAVNFLGAINTVTMTSPSKRSGPSLPAPFASFIAKFPLRTYPRISLPPNDYRPVRTATLWLSPPLGYTPTKGVPISPAENISNLLSADVECLKWQAYIALRGLDYVRVRFDVSPDGALENRLPNLHVPLSESVLPKDDESQDKVKKGEQDGELLAAQMIPTWVDAKLCADSSADENEGYVDEAAKDESRAWVSLLEDAVHAALVCSFQFL